MSRAVALSRSIRPASCLLRFMSTASQTSPAKEKLLFTPGPLTTSKTTKEAMLRDFGSRDGAFLKIVKEVRQGLLKLAGLTEEEFTTVIVQGSGTFGVEATVTSVIPKNGKILVIANGAYGLRMHKIAQRAGIDAHLLNYREDHQPNMADIEQVLKSDNKITHVGVIHSETTTGLVNDINAIGQMASRYGKTFIVDAMSSFGGIPIDFRKAKIDFLVSSSNKCIEGVPGFSFCLARRSALNSSEGNARSVALDLHAQNKGLESNGQFQFTPPTQVIGAFHQALKELELEGGVEARAARYRANRDIVLKELTRMGFKPYLKPEEMGHIISTFCSPQHPKWNFNTFYNKLSDRDFLIYPGKTTNADCFRIGHIGQIYPNDTIRLMKAIEEIGHEMGFLPMA